jgi:D-glycero-alpha-D-manno-heptose-7-phosphate kinase
MIIIRTPLRISICGGGTDLPSYYNIKDSFCISVAINKYIYIIINNSFRKGFHLKYSRTEFKKKIHKIKHPIFREALNHFKIKNQNIEIISIAELQSGTGLGSSGTFTVGLVNALAKYKKKKISKKQIADIACDIEINKLKQNVGKQDQFIASFGGVKKFIFKKNKPVRISNVSITKKNLNKFRDSMLIYYTGITRSADSILKNQNKQTKKNNLKIITNLDIVKRNAIEIEKNLIKGNIKKIGQIMHFHWETKKKRDKKVTSKRINDIYSYALKNGAIGGKLIGAGGGGYLMFITKQKNKLEKSLKKFNLEKLNFNFDFNGTIDIL